MEDVPSKDQMKGFLSAICEQQDKMVRTMGMTRDLNRSVAAKLEPLKTPIYVIWEYLGYGDFPQNRTQRHWLSSFRTSPSDFLSECIMLVKTGDLPIDDLTMRRQLIDFYSDLNESFEL